jgi:glycerol-3-phosphate cytidylyltransferase
MKKYKIGYTTGVFDLFHVGHLNLLKQAKSLCKYLIVGVSTDETVVSYKNKTPVIPFEQRKEIVAAIRYVDEVVSQDNMNKYAAWQKLHFDVLFHGDDWKDSTMYNDVIEKLSKHNVDVVFLKHTKGISSSQLTEKIANSDGK